jgi:hypothetical protein
LALPNIPVTTATLIQHHSVSGEIHLSEATANLLIKAGKMRWVKEREDRIFMAGKGELKTYRLVIGGRAQSGLDQEDFSTAMSSMGDGDSDMGDGELECQQRSIEWNVEVFKGMLKQILARRPAMNRWAGVSFKVPKDVPTVPLEEVKEIIELPDFDKKTARRQRENGDVEVPENVVKELREFITAIADRYNPNPFHNVSTATELNSLGRCQSLQRLLPAHQFAHASYVVMAVTKYMNRIIAAREMDLGDDEERFRSSVMADIHVS